MYKRKYQVYRWFMLVICFFVLPFSGSGHVSAADQEGQSHSAYQIVAENTQAILSVNPDNLAIRIKNKLTGYVWGSTMADIAEKRLNQTWQSFVNSALTIDYVTANNQSRRESIEDGAKITLIPQEEGFQALITFPSNIQLSMEVRLKEDQIHLSIPDDTISEPDNARLTKVTIYPFLGASEGTTIDGYILLPDGSGALIDYQDTARKMTSPYQAPIYGFDPAIERPLQSDNMISPIPVSIPVYGVVHGIDQNGLLTEITSAEEYGTIIAYKAGLATDFHWVTTEFNYRYNYRQPTSAGEVTGLQMVQGTRNPLDIAVSYTLLSHDQANYVGMAQRYQQSLVAKKRITQQSTPAAPLDLTFFGGESMSGLLFDRVIPMTTIDDVRQIVTDFSQVAIDQPRLSYTGWQKGGASKRDARAFVFDRRLGSASELDALLSDWQQQGNTFSLHIDYGGVRQKPADVSDNHFAQQVNGQLVTLLEEMQEFHILSGQGLLQRVERDIAAGKQSSIKHLSLSGIGQFLSADFTRGKEETRSDSKALQAAALQRWTDADVALSLTQPNVYLWSSMAHYIDMPLTTSHYTFVSQAVPFLPIVLKGYVHYTSPYMNRSANQETYLLKNIEYGATPSFLLTSEAPSLLQDTDSAHLYSTQYTQWKASIADYYQQMAQVSSAVGDSTIVAHDILYPDLVKVTYSNGCVIYINYGNTAESVEGLIVDSRSFLIHQEEEGAT